MEAINVTTADDEKVKLIAQTSKIIQGEDTNNTLVLSMWIELGTQSSYVNDIKTLQMITKKMNEIKSNWGVLFGSFEKIIQIRETIEKTGKTLVTCDRLVEECKQICNTVMENQDKETKQQTITKEKQDDYSMMKQYCLHVISTTILDQFDSKPLRLNLLYFVELIVYEFVDPQETR
eukprot:UN30451